MNNSVQRKKGAILSYFSIIINTLIQFLYTPLLIKMLGQSEYGLYSLVANIIGYLTILDLGFGNAIVVYTAKYRAKKEYDKEKKLHGMFNIVFIVIGFIAASLGLILFFNVNNMFSNTMTNIEINKMKIMMLILSFNLMITLAFNIYNSIITAYEKFVFQKILAIIHSLLKPLLMIPLLFMGYKSVTMCIIITITNMVVIISNYIYCKNKLNIKIKYTGFDKILFKTICGYSFWIFLQIIMDKLNWNIDNFLLGIFSGTIAVSIYAVASTINQLFISLSTAISGVFLPKISKMVARNASKQELTQEMIKIGRIQCYIILFMCICLIIIGKDFITFWVGNNFEESYYVALILIIPLCIPLVENIGISILQAMNKYKFYSIIGFTTSIINLLLSIILVQKYGTIGAAIGTGLSMIICHLIMINIYYQTVIKLDVILFWKTIITQIVKLSPSILLIIIIKNFINLSGLPFLIVLGSIYSILFIVNSYTIACNEYEKQLVKTFIKKILKRG